MRGGSAPYPEYGTTIEGLLRFQSAACEGVGSPLYKDILDRAATDYEAGGPTSRVLSRHEDDPGGSALALRLMGAVHRLVLEGAAPQLAERYRAGGDGEPTWSAFRAVLEEHEGRLATLIDNPVQTNEVGRCAALLPGFLEVAERTGLPLRLLEVGASAGLNLGWSEYRYEADGFAWGPPDSPIRVGFELRGGEIPAAAKATVAEGAGCDAAPVDPTTREGRLTLLSYCWPDQAERMERLRAALDLAAARPVAVERGGAVEWVAARLAEPAPGRATVLFHSIVMQYLSEDERQAFEAIVVDAGERASGEALLAWLRMEPDGERAAIRLTTWPGGEDRLLAHSGYHGTPLELYS